MNYQSNLKDPDRTVKLNPTYRQIAEVITRSCTDGQASKVVKGLLHAVETGSAGCGRSVDAHLASRATQRISEVEFIDQLITLCQTSVLPEDVPAVLLEIGDVLRSTGNVYRAAEVYSRVLARTNGASVSSRRSTHQAVALMRRGEVNSSLGRWKESRADLAKSRSLFEELGESRSVGLVDNILGITFAEKGNLGRARESFQKAYVVFEEHQDREMAGTALMNVGILLNIRGQHDEALAQFRRAQSWFEKLGDVPRLAHLHHNMGMAHLRAGQRDAATKEFNTSYFLASKHTLIPVMALALFGKAEATYAQKDLQLAMKLVSQAIELFEKCGDRLGQADGYKLKGMIHRDLKDYGLANSYFLTSLRINSELGNKLNEAETHVEIGVMERRRNRKVAAIKALEEAVSLFRQVGATEQMKKNQIELSTMTSVPHAAG